MSEDTCDKEGVIDFLIQYLVRSKATSDFSLPKFLIAPKNMSPKRL